MSHQLTNTAGSPSDEAACLADEAEGGVSAEFPAPPVELTEHMHGPLPPQRDFSVPRTQWRRKLSGIPWLSRVVTELPERIDRKSALDRFAHLWPHDALGAFVVMLVWAYGPKPGYGPHRALMIVTAQERLGRDAVDPLVEDRLRESVRVAVEDGPAAGFVQMTQCHHHSDPEEPCGHIRGLGPSFFTKWLNFATEAEGARIVTPVLDSRIARWLADHANRIDRETRERLLRQEDARREAAYACGAEYEPDLSEELSWASGWSPTTPEADRIRFPLSPPNAADYERYLALLTVWGRTAGLPPAPVADHILALVAEEKPRARPADAWPASRELPPPWNPPLGSPAPGLPPERPPF
ncbi:hypothetical protein [Brevibacterium album]|uniref:8-oxoguanine DNA glycosylase OGG fold protein n=1 Tax=Brevibacterium album TaxID=417948 RepID=UPI000418F3D7|nr:hypothetical protein [Brevibacterium album]